MIIALASGLNSNFDILRTFASLLARHILHTSINFCKENGRTNNNRFKELKYLNNKTIIQNNINNKPDIKCSPIITLENKNNKEINIPQDNSNSDNSEHSHINLNNIDSMEDNENNDKKEDTDNSSKKDDNNENKDNKDNNDNNNYSKPLSHSYDKQQFLNFCSQVENRIKSSNQHIESDKKTGKRKRNENKKDTKFVNLDETKNHEQNNLDIYDSDANKNSESSNKIHAIKNKPNLNNKIISLEDIILNTPIDLEDFKNPFNGVE